MNYKVVLILAGLLVVLYVKFKDLFLKAKDQALTKEGEQLKSEADTIKVRIKDLEAQQANPGKLLSRDEIEEYWNKK